MTKVRFIDSAMRKFICHTHMFWSLFAKIEAHFAAAIELIERAKEFLSKRWHIRCASIMAGVISTFLSRLHLGRTNC